MPQKAIHILNVANIFKKSPSEIYLQNFRKLVKIIRIFIMMRVIRKNGKKSSFIETITGMYT